MHAIRFFSLFVTLTLLSITTSLVGFDWQSGWEAEVRTAAFRPSSKLFRRIYGNWEMEYQLEVAKQFNDCSDFYGWSSVGFLDKKGHSIPLRDSTRIMMVPLNLGIKYVYSLWSCIDVSLGIGGSCNFVNIKNHTHFLRKRTQKTAWGGIVKSGIRYNFWRSAYLDLFADYTYQHLNFHSSHRKNVDVGGLLLGAGIGLYF